VSFQWISWWQPAGDYRPLSYPPNAAILGWWCTGSNERNGSSICALVKADTEDAAKAAVSIDWPEAESWRFCEPRESAKLSDRFPLGDWMVQRFDDAKAQAPGGDGDA
jgi:hypothetical protein